MIALFLALALSADAGAPKLPDRPVEGAATRIAYAVPSATAPAPASVLSAVAVTLECTARADGRVANCSVLGETHPGLGFGAAAVALVEGSEVAPGRADVQFARTIQFMP